MRKKRYIPLTIISFSIISTLLFLLLACVEDIHLSPQDSIRADRLAEAYRTGYKQVPNVTVKKSSRVYPLYPKKTPLPKTVDLIYGKKRSMDWIFDFGITGLIISVDDSVVFEDYFRGNTPSSPAMNYSVTKSIISALCGVAVKEGLIRSIDDPIDDYVPEFSDSGFQGVSIKDILQMSSGIDHDEKAPDQKALKAFFKALTHGSLDEYTASMKKDIPPGTVLNYQNINTQALGMLIRKVSQKNLYQYLHEKIWEPAGMEFDAIFRTDNHGVEFVPGHFYLTLRDRLRFGLLYLHEGRLNGHQILSPEWVNASHTPDSPHLMPNDKTDQFGYGYHFWVPTPDMGEDDYAAIGVYGQYIYINPTRDVVIAVSAADPNYERHPDIYVYQMIQVFRQLSQHYNRES